MIDAALFSLIHRPSFLASAARVLSFRLGRNTQQKALYVRTCTCGRHSQPMLAEPVVHSLKLHIKKNGFSTLLMCSTHSGLAVKLLVFTGQISCQDQGTDQCVLGGPFVFFKQKHEAKLCFLS